MADALELLLYVQLNGVKIDLIPGQAKEPHLCAGRGREPERRQRTKLRPRARPTQGTSERHRRSRLGACGPVSAHAGSGVGEGADDEDGFVAGVVGGADGAVFGAGVLAAPVADAGLAQVAEPEGVAAGFGREVAAEAEHVSPASQAGMAGVGAEGPAGVDEPLGVGAAGLAYSSMVSVVMRAEA